MLNLVNGKANVSIFITHLKAKNKDDININIKRSKFEYFVAQGLQPMYKIEQLAKYPSEQQDIQTWQILSSVYIICSALVKRLQSQAFLVYLM